MNRFLFLISISLFSGNVFAQPGSNDPTFNPIDQGNFNGDGPNNYVNVSTIQPDGKILIGGLFNTYNGTILPNSTYFSRICRLNPNGTLDLTFNHPVATSLPSEVEDLSLQTDGKLLIVGGNKCVRLMPTGEIDTTFLSSFPTNIKYHSIAIQTNGKILIAGEDNFSGNGVLVRLNEDGSNDNTFNSSLGNGAVYKIVTLIDGTLLIGGQFSVGLRHLFTDGSIDQTFANNLSLSCLVYDIEIQTDNKIIVVGSGITKIKRFNIDGTTDNTFVQPTINNYVKTCELDNLGNLIIGGNFTSVSSQPIKYIAKLSSTGTVDLSFQSDRYASLIKSISIQDDQKIITCTGSLSSTFQDLVRNTDRINPDGSYDFTFNPVTGANGYVNCVKQDDNGNIFIGGVFTRYNNQIRGRVAKLIINGDIDNSFNCFMDGEVNEIEIQSNGKVLIGGNFTKVNGQTVNRLVRLNSDGSIDNSFYNGGFNSAIFDIEIQTDGKILVAGNFSQFDSQQYPGVVRLNSDGTIDSGFSNSNTNYAFQKVHLMVDNTIYLRGGVNGNNFYRVLNNGFIDNSFIPFIQSNSFEFSYILPNGEILLQTQLDDSIFHLDQSGNLLNSLDLTGKALLVQSDGKIICAQSIGSNIPLIRYDSNGTTDTTFNVHNTSNSDISVTGAFQQADGKLLFSGLFGMFDDEGRNRVTRCLNCSPSYTHDTVVSCNPYTWGENNQTYISSGIYTHVFPNITAGGCDSIIVLHYTNLSTNSTANVSQCYSYTWSQTGLEYTTSGIYSDTLTNINGCDSIIYLNLTINNPSYSIDTLSTCDSLNWIDGITYYSSTNTPTWNLTNSLGCDSIVTLHLIVNNSTNGTDIQVSNCPPFVWIDGNSYYAPNNSATFTLPNSHGCDSVITLDLSFVSNTPITINTFSQPSDANSCNGNVSVTTAGTGPFTLNFDNGATIVSSTDYSLIQNLCAGVHHLLVTDPCADSTTASVVIPIDSNYVFNNPFIDSLAQDSLGTTLEDCDIYYAGIDTAYIDSIWATGNTVNVIWNIVDSNGSNFDTTSYVLNNGNGVYYLQLSVLCPNKSIGDYFTVTESIYFEDGTVSSAGIEELNDWNVQLYPNPTNNLVTISYEGQNAELTIYDAQGKLIKQSGIHSGEQVSLREVETGVYFFQLTTGNGSVVKRVVRN